MLKRNLEKIACMSFVRAYWISPIYVFSHSSLVMKPLNFSFAEDAWNNIIFHSPLYISLIMTEFCQWHISGAVVHNSLKERKMVVFASFSY